MEYIVNFSKWLQVNEQSHPKKDTSILMSNPNYRLLGSKKLLFVGDSNTDNDWCYANQIKELFPLYTIHKVAKWGEKTGWMLANLEKWLKNTNTKYDVIALLGGSNDIYGGIPLEQAKENITRIKKLIEDSGAKSMIITPPSKKFFPGKDAEKEKDLAALIRWEKAQNFDYFIDFNEITSKSPVDANNKPIWFHSDLRHPNRIPHGILAKEYLRLTGNIV